MPLPASEITANTAASRLLRQAERDAFAMHGESPSSLLARALAQSLIDGKALSMDQVGATVAAAASFVLAAAQIAAFEASVAEHGTAH